MWILHVGKINIPLCILHKKHYYWHIYIKYPFSKNKKTQTLNKVYLNIKIPRQKKGKNNIKIVCIEVKLISTKISGHLILVIQQ